MKKRNILLALVLTNLIGASVYAAAGTCTVVAHPNGAGWVGIRQENNMLEDYQSDSNKALDKLVWLKDNGICRQRALSCDVVLHSNGAGYSAVTVSGTLVTSFVASMEASQTKLTELQTRGICKPPRNDAQKNCRIQMHPNGAGYSGIVSGASEFLLNYQSSMGETLQKWQELQEQGACAERSLRCEFRNHPNGAGYTAIYAEGDVPLVPYQADRQSTLEKFAELKASAVCE